MSTQTYCELPVMGVANLPEAEMRLRRDDMDRVLGPVKDWLIRCGVTFSQALAIYNDIPVLLTAADMTDAKLLNIINRHCS